MTLPQPEGLDLITRAELAKLLRVSLPTVERMALDGSGPPYIRLGIGKVRARCVYKRSDVEAWLLACRRKSTSD